MVKFALRRASVLAAAVLLATAGSASAYFSLPVADIAKSGSSTGPEVTAECAIKAALLQGDGIQFVVTGSAAASSFVSPAALATHVHCIVKTRPGTTTLGWGGPSGDAPGPVAYAAGTSNTVPFDKLANLKVCAYGTACFQGGIVRTSIPNSGC
jgi:hypothetical protein